MLDRRAAFGMNGAYKALFETFGNLPKEFDAVKASLGDYTDEQVKAVEAVDECVKDVVTVANDNNYTTLIIADHGNCETMMNPDGSPHTSHTTNPVPFILIDKDLTTIKDGVLGDIAPTILKLMGIEQPKEMTQHPLI